MLIWAKREEINLSDDIIQLKVDKEAKDTKKKEIILIELHTQEVEKNANKPLHFVFNTPRTCPKKH